MPASFKTRSDREEGEEGENRRRRRNRREKEESVTRGWQLSREWTACAGRRRER